RARSPHASPAAMRQFRPKYLQTGLKFAKPCEQRPAFVFETASTAAAPGHAPDGKGPASQHRSLLERGVMNAFAERAERRPVELRGFALSKKHDSDILVSNVSYTGCEFMSDDRFKKG